MYLVSFDFYRPSKCGSYFCRILYIHRLSRFVVNTICPACYWSFAEWYVVSCVNGRSSICHGMVTCVLLNFLWQRKNLAPQLPYSSDLAPSDFNLFGALKDAIHVKRLDSHEEVAASSEFKLSECHREASTMSWSWPTKGCCAMDIYIYTCIYIYIYIYILQTKSN